MMVGGHHGTQIFRVELRGKPSRVNQIDENDGQLATFCSLAHLATGAGYGRALRGAAIGTKSLARRVFAAAGVALPRQRRAAVAAESLVVRNPCPATRTDHGAPLLRGSQQLANRRPQETTVPPSQAMV